MNHAGLPQAELSTSLSFGLQRHGQDLATSLPCVVMISSHSFPTNRGQAYMRRMRLVLRDFGRNTRTEGLTLGGKTGDLYRSYWIAGLRCTDGYLFKTHRNTCTQTLQSVDSSRGCTVGTHKISDSPCGVPVRLLWRPVETQIPVSAPPGCLTICIFNKFPLLL